MKNIKTNPSFIISPLYTMHSNNITSRLVYDGYFYHRNAKNKDVTYWRCSKYASARCNGRLKQCGSTITIMGEHSCKKEEKILQCEASEAMLARIDELASTTRMTTQRIFERVISDEKNSSNTAKMIPTKSVISERIKTIRGCNMSDHNPVRDATLSQTKMGRKFLRRDWKGDLNGKDERLLLWASEESLSVLRQNGDIFIDGTFRVVPAGFYQCVVIMALDLTSSEYVPTVWALLSGKSENMYCTLLHEIVVLLDYQWMPSICVCDFERGLLGAARYQFPDSQIIGCYFHLKQSLYRKMRELTLPADQIDICIDKIEILTLIPPGDISIGISFIRSKIKNEDPIWNNFWEYFDKTWMQRFQPSLWNIESIIAKKDITRTNNALESYNGRLNNRFPCPHPNIAHFVEVLQDEEDYYTKLTREIRIGSVKRKDLLKRQREYIIPAEYRTFRNNILK